MQVARNPVCFPLKLLLLIAQLRRVRFENSRFRNLVVERLPRRSKDCEAAQEHSQRRQINEKLNEHRRAVHLSGHHRHEIDQTGNADLELPATLERLESGRRPIRAHHDQSENPLARRVLEHHLQEEIGGTQERWQPWQPENEQDQHNENRDDDRVDENGGETERKPLPISGSQHIQLGSARSIAGSSTVHSTRRKHFRTRDADTGAYGNDPGATRLRASSPQRPI